MREQERVTLAIPDGPTDLQDTQESGPPATAQQTFALYCQGLSIAEIAAQRGLVSNTIEGHLVDCVMAGLEVDLAGMVSIEEREQIEQAIKAHGAEKLKSLRDSLPETITYNQIRLVVAQLMKSQASDQGMIGKSARN
jgi:ATP-dependent DNA helicase RecQ